MAGAHPGMSMEAREFQEDHVPTDSTPDPRDMERLPEAQQIPQARSDRSVEATPDIGNRPPLPDRPLISDADVEAETGHADRGPGKGAGPGSPDGELNRR